MTKQPANTQSETKKARLLHSALKANAIFSTISGLFFTIGSNNIADSIALEDGAWFILLIGVGLLPFAAFVYYIATRPQIDHRIVNAIIVMDFAWVIGSAILLLTDLLGLNNTGDRGVLLIASIVLMFAIMQIIGLRQIKHEQNRQQSPGL